MKTTRIYTVALAAALLAAPAAFGSTATWTGAFDTSWTNDLNWTGGAPGAGVHVVVPNTTVKPTMAAGTYPPSGAYATFAVSNGVTIACLGDTNVINEASGGTTNVKHGIGVTIHTTNATIVGILDANERGFPGTTGPGSAGISGASHGGRPSGSGTTPVYGSLTQPTALGSGGTAGAGGGGAIRLVVHDTLTLNGTVRANGNNSVYGAGSGGSVWLAADVFKGTGVVQAAGGGDASVFNRTAGGGRVAIEYNSSSFSGSVSVAGGWGGQLLRYSQPGTLWEPGKVFPTNGALTVRESYQYHFPNTNTLYRWALTVSNAWFEVHGGRAAISNLTVRDSVFTWGRLAANQAGVSGMTNLTLTGRVTVTNTTTTATARTALFLPAGNYALTELIVATNSILVSYPDTNVVNEASGGTSDKRHGAGAVIRCANARIDGMIGGMYGSADSYRANNEGFNFQSGPGYTTANAGGAHGGRGASQAADPYGRLARPTALGSGGSGGYGGGALKLRVDGTLALNGSINLSGVHGGSSRVGGGAGGSVWLIAGTLTGNGPILAIGGESGAHLTRGGGGGRVALECGPSSTYGGQVSVANAPSGTSRTGTVFRCVSVAPGASDDAGYGGAALETLFTTNSFLQGVVVTRELTQWKPPRAFAWRDTSMDAGSNPLANEATYLLSGLEAGRKYSVLNNGAPLFAHVWTNASPAGELQFAVTLDEARTVEVLAQPLGSLILLR